MAAPITSTAAQTIINIVFGLTATGIGIVTVWQGRRAWKIWHDRSREADVESNLESHELSEGADLRTLPAQRHEASAAERFELPMLPTMTPIDVVQTPYPNHTHNRTTAVNPVTLELEAVAPSTPRS